MMRSTTLYIAACWLLGSSALRPAFASPGSVETGPASSAACLRCHEPARGVFAGPMATRSSEREFARRAFGAESDHFFAGACEGCHVAVCADCHGEDPHRAGRPKDEACLRCHRGYSAGWEYEGRAPREDHARYRRGETSQGEPFLKMLPDVHFERGMRCADCHTMKSLQEGKRAAMDCRDCHAPAASASPEHAIAAHLEKLSCVACHAAWAPRSTGRS